jgi:xylitol oxidase
MATNWAGNYTYGAERVHEPTSLDELRSIVGRARRIKALGSRHAFNAIADSGELVSLAHLPADIDVGNGQVSCGGGVTYGALAHHLDGHALHNLASLPHISVAGAIATATHGSGDRNGNLATAVRSLELLTADGELRTVTGDEWPVSFGALGIVTRVTLELEPAYEVRQRVFEHLSWDALHEHFDEIMAAAYSVSVFTRWRDDVDMVWLKARDEPRAELFDGTPASVHRHPIMELDPVNCTRQLGEPGPWWDRLPHFRMGFTPSNGDEIQSEYHVPREHAVPAIKALQALAPRIAAQLQVSELRTVAADSLWMSPQYERDTLGIHFTWKPEPIEDVLIRIEAALAEFDYRAHLGKVFVSPGDYPRREDFVRLAQTLDPQGVFRNSWFVRHLM